LLSLALVKKSALVVGGLNNGAPPSLSRTVGRNIMRLSTKFDIVLNILFPIIIGACIYMLNEEAFLEGFIRNHLSDGLWAYALISSILVIWNRQINRYWITLAFFIFIGFESLQYFHLINGTFDLWDILVYLIFSGLAIVLNKFFISLTSKKSL
jgi:hypothetical protein